MTSLSDYDPETHAGPKSFYTIPIDDVKDAGLVDDCKECDPQPVVESPSGTCYAPEGTEAAEYLKEAGATEIEPGDPDRDMWEGKWRSVHEDDGL